LKEGFFYLQIIIQIALSSNGNIPGTAKETIP
jgi:hypothetical protein